MVHLVVILLHYGAFKFCIICCHTLIFIFFCHTLIFLLMGYVETGFECS